MVVVVLAENGASDPSRRLSPARPHLHPGTGEGNGRGGMCLTCKYKCWAENDPLPAPSLHPIPLMLFFAKAQHSQALHSPSSCTCKARPANTTGSTNSSNPLLRSPSIQSPNGAGPAMG
ncbi:hypothetical protein E2C01_100191 [Portunus trituberculatus]|uniref:Uncharacterized protein n=1 Tax=Portunus trituberculatus TaxID=210409 RepID=A0A5B7KGR9_PORTR|nr:hypothetical protein [Portunus trituberculatus]